MKKEYNNQKNRIENKKKKKNIEIIKKYKFLNKYR